MPQKKTSKKQTAIKPIRSGQVPVTQKMLSLTKGELKSEITSVKLQIKALSQKTDARFNQVDAQFKNIDARFNQVDAQFKNIDSRFNQIQSQFKNIDSRFDEMDSTISTMNSKLEMVLAAIYRTNALVEEQNSKNNVVLDGYEQIYRRLEEIDKRLNLNEK